MVALAGFLNNDTTWLAAKGAIKSINGYDVATAAAQTTKASALNAMSGVKDVVGAAFNAQNIQTQLTNAAQKISETGIKFP